MRFGALAIVVASVLWGTTGTAASTLPASVGPLAVGAATMTLGGALLFATAARGAFGVLRGRAARRWLLLGAMGVVVYPLAFYSGMDLAGVAIGNVVALGSGPLFAALLEWRFERRALGRRWRYATLVAVVGVALVGVGGVERGETGRADAAATSFAGLGPAGASAVGIAFALLAGLAYALYTYCSTRALAIEPSSRAVMGALFGLGALALLPVLVATQLASGGALIATPQTAGTALYLAVGPMFLAYLAFGAGLRSVRSSTATTITLLEPVVATLLAVVVVGERLTALGWAGLALVLIAVAAVVTQRTDAPVRAHRVRAPLA